MELSLARIGEHRTIGFFENASETMPSQETPDTKQEKRVNETDTTPERKDRETEDATEKMMQRIEQGESSRKAEMKTLQSAETFQKKFDMHDAAEKSEDDVLATASKDAGDIAEESADIGMLGDLDDISNEIGKKTAPNETPETARTETQIEGAPAEKKTEDEGVKREQEETTKKEDQTGAPKENPEGNKPH